MYSLVGTIIHYNNIIIIVIIIILVYDYTLYNN